MSDNLTRLVAMFEEADDVCRSGRDDAMRGRDYYDGRQLTAEQIKALNKRKQPIVIENLVQPKVDYLCGLERQTRTDPKAYPRTMAHDDDANAATDALRYVADDQGIDVKRSAVFQNMLVEGYGGVEVTAARVRNAIDPVVTHIEWSRLFYDPHSSRADFSDANYMGFITWMDESAAVERWPEGAAAIKTTLDAGVSFEDKPTHVSWSDKRKRVRIVTIYCLVQGVWCRSVFTRGGELEPLAPSPFIDENGNPECALILQSAYIDRDNDRYGIVRNLFSLQDEVNKRRGKFLHLSNSRQVRIGASVQVDAETVRKEMSQPDGVIVAESGDLEILGSGDMAAGHFQLLAEAKAAIQMVGPNATMQGKAGQDQSGRAILALQQGGMTEMAPLLDGLRDFNIRLFRSVWNRIRQFWTGERWVRVTDDEKNVRFSGLNVTKGVIAAQKIMEAVKAGKITQEQAQQMAMQIQSDPSMQQPANAIAEMDVDIQIDEVQNAPTLQIEQFEQLAKIAPMAPPEFIPAVFEMMIEASNLRNKDKLREIVQQKQQPNPMVEQQQQIARAGAQAEVEKTQSETAKNMASAQAAMAKAATDGFAMGMAA